MIRRLTIGHVRLILDATGVDLLRVHDPGVWAAVSTDHVWLCRALIAFGVPGADRLEGDRLDKASAEFMDLLLAFFPEPTGRDADVDDPDDFDPWAMVYQAAGVAGVDPSPHSLRELLWMADGAYSGHAQTHAMIYNAMTGKRDKAKSANDFNPYARPGAEETTSTKARRVPLFH